jgi:acyl transferase domain-containing protein/thioesterase domain-containing protein/acyl carrier protein
MSNSETYDSPEGIAIVGMSGRFPGAKSVAEFWENLRNGMESISTFSKEELEAAGRGPALLNHPDFVNAGGVLDGIELFDASFFGFNPREAEVIDPQQRLFMECSWQALEDAGYDPETFSGSIGVYAGAAMGTYIFNLVSNRDVMGIVGGFQVMIGNDKDHLTTHVSYKLNLKGPSVAVQTACSTSLVAVCMACQSLLDHQCDMALAGGVGIKVPQKTGYLYQEGMINSPDGHCRTFDAEAKGTVGGNGVGIVVLKRLCDAIADRDNILAVIKGSAINNDGALKVGYTAPSVEGQAEVIAMAQAMADVEPETITYVEAHGTATPLGDPIEIAALTKAFRAGTQKKNFCGIGSVKSNVGHLNTAAGVAALIKTVLMLKHKMLAPSLHFKRPNPGIDFANSPFYVNAKLTEWERGATPRRAGVSSFGIGGTNAHVIVEEAPESGPPAPTRPAQLLLLSAKTSTALETATANLVEHLKQNPDSNFADLAYTRQVGRRAFSHRRMLVCQNADTAVSALGTLDPRSVLTAHGAKERPVVFMFPGQGAQYLNMTRELYEVEPTFRRQVDVCSEVLSPLLGQDLRQLLYPESNRAGEVVDQLGQTAFSQPALFVIEYALAQLWMEWGVRPQAMIGHSIGEYVAACLAGVFSLEDALSLIAARGRMMQEMPGGSMLAVSLSEKEVRTFLDGTLDLAAVNGTSMCVVSGPQEEVARLEVKLNEEGKSTHHLHTSHAFHSRMMDPLLEPFKKLVRKIDLKRPTIPFISNFTGTWITAEAATDPDYWARHLRQTVRFAEGLQELLKGPDSVLLEVGPGETLSTLVRQYPPKNKEQVIISSVRRPQAQRSDVEVLLHALGRLWLSGQSVNWPGIYKYERRRRLSLPPYPFERQRYWVEARKVPEVATALPAPAHKRRHVTEWFYAPSWKRPILPEGAPQANTIAAQSRWLIFSDAVGLGSKLIDRLHQQTQEVIVVTAEEQFAKRSAYEYTINPRQPDDYQTLFKNLHATDKLPQKILHLWSVTPEPRKLAAESFDEAQEMGFYSLLALAQALGAQNIIEPLQIGVISNRVHLVTGEETLQPEKATVLGACKVIPQEFPNIRCRNIDVVLPAAESRVDERLLDQLIAELTAVESLETVVAYRGGQRWTQIFEQARLDESTDRIPLIREGGVYLITGGLGNIGLALAEELARTARARLVLVGRSAFPAKENWLQWLSTHDEQDAVSRKIRRLQTIESLGAQVIVFSADVADRDQMRGVMQEASARFGKINGVIHGAGDVSAGAFSAVHQTDHQNGARHFQPKAQGLLVLEELFQRRDLDFWVLLSSLSVVLGGLGLAAYSAANIFMDAFASQQNRAQSVPWFSINWDGWDFEGNLGEEMAASAPALAMLPKEGVEAFRRILSRGTLRQVVVSVGDLHERIAQWINLESLRPVPPPAKDNAESHARPALTNQYVAPRNKVEQTIADVWRELLGIEQVGIHDDFFELGGHSLLAVQLVSKIGQEFGQRIPIVSLFEHATVESLAEMLRKDVDKLVWPTFVEIQPSGSKPPLFCVSTPNVNALGYRALARLLGQDQPVYGLQAQYPEDLEGEHSQAAVDELATDYLEAMRSVRPHGPYQLIGMCRGAHIAYEMARRLEAEGQKVALLGILDTWVLENTYSYYWYLEHYARRASLFLRMSRREQLEFIKKKARDFRAALGVTAGEGPTSRPRKIDPLHETYFPGAEFVPPTYGGRISIFRVRRQPRNRIRDAQLGWGKHTIGGINVHFVPGKHGTVLEESNVSGLAAVLKPALMEDSDGESSNARRE